MKHQSRQDEPSGRGANEKTPKQGEDSMGGLYWSHEINLRHLPQQVAPDEPGRAKQPRTSNPRISARPTEVDQSPAGTEKDLSERPAAVAKTPKCLQ